LPRCTPSPPELTVERLSEAYRFVDAIKEADEMTDVTGLHEWERREWIAPSDEGLPDWLRDLRAKHLASLDEYERSIAGVVNTSAHVQAEARAWRREVRDALAQGKPPPERNLPPEVGEATVEIAVDDTGLARDELAIVCTSILEELRLRADDFAAHFFEASSGLRAALFRGPDGLDEPERQRRERLLAEVAVVDITDPTNAALTELGQQEAINVTA
jgi:hypothetical protein